MNSRNTLVIVVLIALGIGAVAGILGYTWVVGGDGTASEPISAPTLDINALPTLNPTQAFDAVTQVAALSAQVESLQATVVASTGDTETTEDTTDTQAESTTTRTQYRIVPENSLASFSLDEDLRGSRVTVIGTTSEVAGDIIVDFANPASSQIGTIRINARTIATDNQFRDRALRAEILLSSQDEFEFIEFIPTALNNLPETVTVGETYTFDIVGNLTIINTTNEVAFTTQVTLGEAGQLTGSATTTILYEDWNISIPSAPGVANITDEVILTIDFVATEVTG